MKITAVSNLDSRIHEACVSQVTEATYTWGRTGILVTIKATAAPIVGRGARIAVWGSVKNKPMLDEVQVVSIFRIQMLLDTDIIISRKTKFFLPNTHLTDTYVFLLADSFLIKR